MKEAIGGSRKALLVGIDKYPDYPLRGCVKDASTIRDLLSRNENGEKNFHCMTMLADPDVVTEETLNEALRSFFSNPADFAVFHFSGHGTTNNLGGFLATQDARQYNDGIRMKDVIDLANQSPIDEILITIDCCHAGSLGNLPQVDNTAQLREGVAVLAGARDTQYAMEKDDEDVGLFTSLLASGLSGGAADVLGRVTAASLYAYVDQSLSPLQQRPLFKAHLSRFAPLRYCKPALTLDRLRILTKYFAKADTKKKLDPSYEHTVEPRDEDNEAVFANLQRMRAARLVEPVTEEHLYWEAINSGACQLTPLGKFYWSLVKSDMI